MRKSNGMRAVDVKFRKLEISKVDLRGNSAEVRLIVNDGKDKALVSNFQLDDLTKRATDLIAELRTKMKTAHKSQDIAEDILGGFVIIRFKDDEESIIEKIAKFLNTIKESVRLAQAGRMSYYDAEEKCRKHVLEF